VTSRRADDVHPARWIGAKRVIMRAFGAPVDDRGSDGEASPR
jgi:hypothetical protein